MGTIVGMMTHPLETPRLRSSELSVRRQRRGQCLQVGDVRTSSATVIAASKPTPTRIVRRGDSAHEGKPLRLGITRLLLCFQSPPRRPVLVGFDSHTMARRSGEDVEGDHDNR